MPKRFVDGDAIATSQKLLNVQPLRYRAEISYLLTLAEANGTFQADPLLVHRNLYLYNRPDISDDDVRLMLDEYERVKMLFRFRGEDGRVWGWWVGSEKPGRIIAKSQQFKYKDLGAGVPWHELERFLQQKPISKTGESRSVLDSVQSHSRVNLDPVYQDDLDGGQERQTGLIPIRLNGLGGSRVNLDSVQSESRVDLESLQREENRKEKNRIEPASPESAYADDAAYAAATSSLSFSSSNGNGSSRCSSGNQVSGQIQERGFRWNQGESFRDEISEPDSRWNQEPLSSGNIETGDTNLDLARVDRFASLRVLMHPLRVTDKDFDPLDFAFTLTEPFAGFTPSEVQRIVWYHWRELPPTKRWWADPAKGIKSAARLKGSLPAMAKQVPTDFRMSGSVYQPVMLSDPNCKLCNGSGDTLEPCALYEEWMQLKVYVACPCMHKHPAPWRLQYKTEDL